MSDVDEASRVYLIRSNVRRTYLIVGNKGRDFLEQSQCVPQHLLADFPW